MAVVTVVSVTRLVPAEGPVRNAAAQTKQKRDASQDWLKVRPGRDRLSPAALSLRRVSADQPLKALQVSRPHVPLAENGTSRIPQSIQPLRGPTPPHRQPLPAGPVLS